MLETSKRITTWKVFDQDMLTLNQMDTFKIKVPYLLYILL